MTETVSHQIRIVVVDDSAFMRKALSMMLESDPAIKVVGTARDGEEGVEKVRQLKPDLVTMDIEMPRMDGLTALRRIMSSHPVPVMMISSLTTDGAAASLDALDLGAVDFIPKQLSYVSLDIVKIKEELLEKIKNIVRRKHILMAKYKHRLPTSPGSRPAPAPATPAASRIISRKNHRVEIVALGCSTGGPPALQAIIPKLPRGFPVGFLVAQHMPATFTKSLADRLNQLSQVSVKEAENGETVAPGTVYIAPGGQNMTIKKAGARVTILVSKEPDTLYKPSVDIMVTSVASQFGGTSLGVILTGMGQDGLEGMRLVKTKGGQVIAQNEDTCVVYGMPRAVVEANLADFVVPIQDVSSEIVSYF